MKKAQAKSGFTLADGGRIILIAVFIAVLIIHFVLSSTIVDGHSMEETLQNGDRLIVWKLGVSEKNLSRGDLVVFHAPDDRGKDYIKRIIAFPNEYVQIDNGLVYINGKRLDEPYISNAFTHVSGNREWYVGEGELFVMGDNRQEGASKDSRIFGSIPAKSIVGKAVFRYYPLSNIGEL